MRHLLLFLLVISLTGCVTDSEPARLPEPTAEVYDPEQWADYCKRKEFDDPACKEHHNE